MKISQRLQQIDRMITHKYDHIWDCCCDHGQLGAALLERRAATNIHFVDVVPELMTDLEARLERFFPLSVTEPLGKNQAASCRDWQVHCQDVASLSLPKGDNQLLVIAGVGGELMTELVGAILTAHPQQEIEFILCPVHHNYRLRQELAALGLGLLDEVLLRENRRFYEIIHVSTTSERPLSKVGSKMWDWSRADDREYLQRTLNHYRRMQHGAGQNVSGILADYQALQP